MNMQAVCTKACQKSRWLLPEAVGPARPSSDQTTKHKKANIEQNRP